MGVEPQQAIPNDRMRHAAIFAASVVSRLRTSPPAAEAVAPEAPPSIPWQRLHRLSV